MYLVDYQNMWTYATKIVLCNLHKQKKDKQKKVYKIKIKVIM